MAERSGPNSRGNEQGGESLEDVRDRLSAFVGEDEGSSSSGEGVNNRNVVVKRAVREHVEDMAVASEFYEPLNEAVDELLADAARRARANGRKTVQARDL